MKFKGLKASYDKANSRERMEFYLPETVELECLDMAAVRGCAAEVNWTKFCHFLAAQFVHQMSPARAH